MANLKIALMVQVVSDKKLVKHLQKEVERLEAELRSPEPSSASYLQSLLIKKNLQIEQVHECVEKWKSKLVVNSIFRLELDCQSS